MGEYGPVDFPYRPDQIAFLLHRPVRAIPIDDALSIAFVSPFILLLMGRLIMTEQI